MDKKKKVVVAFSGGLDTSYTVLYLAKEMGYENYLEPGYFRMNRNCYGREEVEAFRKQIKEYFVPFVHFQYWLVVFRYNQPSTGKATR